MVCPETKPGPLFLHFYLFFFFGREGVPRDQTRALGFFLFICPWDFIIIISCFFYCLFVLCICPWEFLLLLFFHFSFYYFSECFLYFYFLFFEGSGCPGTKPGPLVFLVYLHLGHFFYFFCIFLFLFLFFFFFMFFFGVGREGVPRSPGPWGPRSPGARAPGDPPPFPHQKKTLKIKLEIKKIKENKKITKKQCPKCK